jgi:hypothetical protein
MRPRSMTYNPKFDIPEKSFNFSNDLAFGHMGEDFVKTFYESVIQGSAEVKTDRYRNGRMVVETNQNPRRETDVFGYPVWKQSGINVTTATWWIYIYSLNSSMVVVSVARLKNYLRANKELFNETTKRMFAESSDNPAKGFLLEPENVMEMLYSKQYD